MVRYPKHSLKIRYAGRKIEVQNFLYSWSAYTIKLVRYFGSRVLHTVSLEDAILSSH